MQSITNRKTKEQCKFLRKEVIRTYLGDETIWIVQDSKRRITRWREKAAENVFDSLPI